MGMGRVRDQNVRMQLVQPAHAPPRFPVASARSRRIPGGRTRSVAIPPVPCTCSTSTWATRCRYGSMCRPARSTTSTSSVCRIFSPCRCRHGRRPTSPQRRHTHHRHPRGDRRSRPVHAFSPRAAPATRPPRDSARWTARPHVGDGNGHGRGRHALHHRRQHLRPQPDRPDGSPTPVRPRRVLR